MYFLHAINSDRQTRLLNVLGQIAMIMGDLRKLPAKLYHRSFCPLAANTLLFSTSKWDTLSHLILSQVNTLQIFCSCGHEIRLNIVPIYD